MYLPVLKAGIAALGHDAVHSPALLFLRIGKTIRLLGGVHLHQPSTEPLWSSL
jgi:hypothetical protein